MTRKRTCESLVPLTCAITLMLGANPSSGQEFRSLTEVLGQEKSIAILLYVLRRCAAVYITVSDIFGADQVTPGADESEQQARGKSVQFTEALYEYSQRMGITKTREEILIDVTEVTEIYTSIAQDNYITTGSYIDGILRDDLDLCAQQLAN